MSEIGNCLLQQAQAPRKSMCTTGPFTEASAEKFPDMVRWQRLSQSQYRTPESSKPGLHPCSITNTGTDLSKLVYLKTEVIMNA